MESSQNTGKACNFSNCHLFNENQSYSKIFLNINKKYTVYFHYHLKCQNIADNEGDIELGSMESSQNTEIACILSKSRLSTENRRYFRHF